MVTINPSDPDSRSSSASAPAMAPLRELPHDPEPMFSVSPVTRGWAGTSGGVPWGGVIGGSLTVISILVMSSALAVACSVPAYTGGAYGWGAGLWAIISSIVAFFFGGMVAGLVRPYVRMSGALRGVLTWALSIPLMLVISASSLGFLHASLGSATTGILVPAGAYSAMSLSGAAWGTFFAMILGLVAAVIGGGFGETGGSSMSATK